MNYRVLTPDYKPSFWGCKEVDLELSNPIQQPQGLFRGECAQADDSKLPLTAQEIISDHICYIMDL